MTHTKEDLRKIAHQALEMLKKGIDEGNRRTIFDAYSLTEDKDFSWDELDEIFTEWNDLVDDANDILES